MDVETTVPVESVRDDSIEILRTHTDTTRSRDANASAALTVFVLLEVIAAPFLVYEGRGMWFWNDDWAFLDGRLVFGRVLLRNYYGHWSTLPNLAYWAIWDVFGGRYRVYQLLLIALHLAVVALLRVVMRRAGVGPWTATIVAAVLLVFGTGAEDILVAFQIVFVGALFFGLVQMLLADHEGRLDWRDWAGLGAGAAALMCSNVAIPLVAAVGLAMLLRRGWRVALFHTAPLAAVYAAWWFLISGRASGLVGHATPGEVVRFVGIGLGATFRGLGHRPLLGVLLATVLVAGMYLALQSRGRAGMLDVLRAYAVPFSLLVGAVAFFLVTGLERANPALEGIGPAVARRSRYLYVGAALSLPAIAVAVEQLKTRSRALAVAALVVLVAGVPGNVHRLDEFHRAGEYGMYRRDVLAFARTPITDSVPADTLVRLANVQGMTIGWLRHAVASHELPAPAHMKPKVVASATMRLALGRAIFPAAGCRPLRTPTAVTIRNDQIISVRSGAVTVHYVSPVDGGVAAPFSITPSTPVRARVGGLRVQLVPAGTGTVACGLSR